MLAQELDKALCLGWQQARLGDRLNQGRWSLPANKDSMQAAMGYVFSSALLRQDSNALIKHGESSHQANAIKPESTADSYLNHLICVLQLR